MKLHYLYFSFDAWLKLQHHAKVQKISLDAHMGCPNRDGTISHGGCIFCDALGSGSGLMEKGLTLKEQWKYWLDKFHASDRLKNTSHFLAYLQSFSNTYGTLDRLKKLTEELTCLDKCVGYSIGTRPDCVEDEKLTLLAELPFQTKWIEFGVQSMHDKTLERIRRGHSVACSVDAVKRSHEHGLTVCVHLMAGLPGETKTDFLETVQKVCELPIQGIKLHGLYICKNTQLAMEYDAHGYMPMEQEDYINLICDALCLIPSHIAVHRLTADCQDHEQLIAPEWAKRKGVTPAQFSLMWILSRKSWIVPIPGTTNLDHLDDLVGATDVYLTAYEMEEFDREYSKLGLMGHRADPFTESQIDK